MCKKERKLLNNNGSIDVGQAILTYTYMLLLLAVLPIP